MFSMQELGRLHDIAAALVRYGFGDMVRRLRLAGILEKAGKLVHSDSVAELARLDTPQRIRRVLEELGPTFVKLGQILATRVDLFPPEWIAEFEKLQDEVPPVPFGDIRAQLEKDLPAPIEDVFTWLDPEPLAAGSIAQVHRAHLPEGDEVVVKVRRPGIRQVIEADLRLMKRLAGILERDFPEFRQFHPQDVLRQFTLSLRRELDLRVECRNAERIAHSLADDKNIVIPKIYWQWTSERVNVQEFIDGIPGRDLKSVDAAGLDRKVLARVGADAMLKMIFIDGFFHADPHPGNVFYLPGNRVAFIDFGMVGRISQLRRQQLVELLHGIASRDVEQASEVLLDWAVGEDVDRDQLIVEFDAFIDHYRGASLKQLRFSDMVRDFTMLLRDHHLALPADLALLTKAFVSLEGMGRELDPDFQIMAYVEPFVRRILLMRYAPDALARSGWQMLLRTASILSDLPQDLRQLMRELRKGHVRLHAEIEDMRHLGERIDRAASRMAMSLVIAALIVGSSIVMTVTGGPTVMGLPLFGLMGFIGAVIGGVWLLFSIWSER